MTNEPLHFSRSPLTEAVIEIRVTPTSTVDLAQLATLHDAERDRYPTMEAYHEHSASIVFDEQRTAPTVTQEHIGYQFVSADSLQLVRVTETSFTCIRLAPYETWSIFAAEARRWWLRYREAVQPASIDRVAVRYINRFIFPNPVIDLENYFRVLPQIADDLPQQLGALHVRLALQIPDIGATLLLTQASTAAPSDSEVSFILDIDIFREQDIPADEAGLWEYLEILRHKKNEIFVKSITAKTQELIR